MREEHGQRVHCDPRQASRTEASDPDLEGEARFFRGQSQMSSLLGGGGVLRRGWRVSAQLALMGGVEGERGDWHLNPSHLPRVTRYSLSMLFSHDQGR